MPYRHAFRRYSASNDVQVVSVPLNEGPGQWHEQEMDFTYQQNDAMNEPAFNMNPLMTSKAIDTDMSYLRPSADHRHNPTALSAPSSLYESEGYSYSQLMGIDSEGPPLDHPREPSLISNSASSSRSSNVPSTISEKLCPLLAGEVDKCEPLRCGPDAPCMNFANLPPIEECTSIPCISSPATSSISASPEARLPKRQSTTRDIAPSLPTISPPQPSLPPSIAETTPQASRYKPRRPARTRHQLPKNDTKTKAQIRAEAKQRAKAAHSLVEKKYRENLNTKLTLLHTTLQNAYYGPQRGEEEVVGSDCDFDEREGDAGMRATKGDSSSSISKFRKSDVLSDAMSYVNQTEVEMRHMENELQRLNDRVRTLEKLGRCEDCSSSKGVVGLQMEPV